MENKLFLLLKKYNLSEDTDYQAASECQNNLSKWEQFIESFILPDLQDDFKKDLHLQLFQKDNKQTDQQIFLKQFVNLKEKNMNLQEIKTLDITDYKWSDSALKQIHNKTISMIQKSIEISSNLSEFMGHQFGRIFDILRRKSNLKSYFDCIKQIIYSKKTSKLIDLLKSLRFADFIIIISHYIYQKQLIGEALCEVGLPTPIYYQIGSKKYNVSQITKNIIGVDKFSLILNVGSPQTRNCGKTSFLAKIMNIDENSISSSFYFSNIIHIYNKFSFSNSQKSLLIDFNGSFQNSTDENLKNLLYIISQCSSLLIVHLSQTEMQNKLLETMQYRRICQNVPKILVYIRDTQKMTLNKLKLLIPQYMKSKTILKSLKNFSTKPLTIQQNVKAISELIQVKYNILDQREVNIFEIKQKHRETDNHPQVLSRITKLMNFIDQPHYRKSQILPNVCKSEKLFDIYQLKRKQTQSGLIMTNYQQTENSIKKQLRNPQLSYFASEAIQILSNSKDLQQIFRKKIYQWKRKKEQPLRDQFLLLTNQLHNIGKDNIKRNQIIKKIERNKYMRSNYQLSLDTIINELVFYLCPNGKIIDHKARTLIERYYWECMIDVSPINIIQGNTLTFGNLFIQDIIYQLNHNYENQNKRIYVVSVIGAQSSAKSTLLNYLFRCKFQTSAGRCTKGIYMNICQLDDLVIVVLDTQGLLSISERNKVFDHQIATFILKISNLIIINNKGQLTNTLKEMLQVCLYVLNCLHKDQSKSEAIQYCPQKILFTLRDQDKPKGKFQEQMAAQIQNSLQQMNEKSGVDYKKFLSIEAKDIFSLPNPFNYRKPINNQTPKFTTFEQSFGDCIIGLRKRIVDYLKGTKPQQNLRNFYHSARKIWETIQVCGEQIMYYKNINEIVIKNEIQQIYLSQIDDYQNICINSYNDIDHRIQNLTKNDPDKQFYLNEQLHNINKDNCERLTQQFKRLNNCTNKQIISEYCRKIKKLCYDCFYLKKQKLNNIIQAIKRSQKDAEIKRNVNQYISQLLDGTKDSKLILQKYQLYSQNELKTFKQNQEKNSQAQSQTIHNIRRTFDKMLQKVKDWQLKINNIISCEQNYQKIKIDWRLQSIIEGDYKKMSWNLKHYKNILWGTFSSVQSNVINYLKLNHIRKHSQIPMDPQWCLTQIQFADLKLQAKIRKDELISEATINNKKLSINIFGLVFKKTKQFIINTHRAYLTSIQNKLKSTLEFGKIQITKLFQFNGNFIKAICHDINFYSNQLINNKISTFEHKIKQNISQLSYKLNPQRIFLQAMRETLLNDDEQNQKRYYIKCYKLVSNINQYLFEMLCNNQLIITRNAMICLQLNKIIELTNIQLSKTIQQIKLKVEQKNIVKLKEFFIKYGMIVLAHFDLQKFFNNKILSKLFNAFEIARKRIINVLLQKINKLNPQKMIQHYICTDLRRKIIGCQICCPVCNMKCMLQTNHKQNHKISDKCHSLSAFAGVSNCSTKAPVLSICHQKANMICRWRYGTVSHPNLKVYIDINYPKWSDQFPNINEQHRFQDFGNATKLRRIWANIQNAIVQSKVYEYNISIPNPIITQLKDKDQLTSEDLQTSYQRPLTKQKHKLKQFKHIKIDFDLKEYRPKDFIVAQRILSENQINENKF